ncbi:hypothetical protein Tco_0831963 [Tanacetum coccineum]
MAGLPRCDELQRTANSLKWEPMMILYCRRAIAEDYRLAREITKIYGQLAAVIEEKDHFIQEWDVLVGRRVLEKTAKFMKETQAKDNQ